MVEESIVCAQTLPASEPTPAEPPSVDFDLVRRAAEGDARATAWVVRRLLPRVRAIARALTASAADADDATQLALVRIVRSLASFRGEAGLETWAKRIAVRATLRFLETERRKPEPMDADGGGASERSGAWEALPRDVGEYLRELPLEQRNAMVLHHALGYSLEEIADLTGVGPNTVKGRLRLATKSLRKLVRRDVAIGCASSTRRSS